MTFRSADQLSVRLQEVYEELQAIEADKAFARAAGILFGLGFDSESQKRPTKRMEDASRSCTRIVCETRLAAPGR
ncbi:hypothetical protein D918_06681 [Trichuris suis]|nr:hypothetical protein D918_06681 [Trichuris suis]